jgi:hypothetical protein
MQESTRRIQIRIFLSRDESMGKLCCENQDDSSREVRGPAGFSKGVKGTAGFSKGVKGTAGSLNT